MKKLARPLLALFAVSLLAAVPVLAADPPAAASGPLEPFLKCLTILDLTDAQKADVREVLDAEKGTLLTLGHQLATDTRALKDLMATTNPDPCAVGRASLKVKADGEAVKAELTKIKTSVLALFTPDQKAKYEGCLAGFWLDGNGQ
jgi:Spy/CpxP family protein refolding chaperone